VRRSRLIASLLVVALASACAGEGHVSSSSPGPTPTATSPSTSPACPAAPAWSGRPSAFGVNVSTHHATFEEALRRVDATFARPSAVRVYDPDVPQLNTWAARGPLLAGRDVVMSFRAPPAAVLSRRYDDRLLHFFSTTPRDITLFWTLDHEPEAAIDAGEFTSSEYQEAFRHVARLAARVCRPNIFPTLILTGWTANPASGRNWHRYYPGADYVSVLGWDPYNHPGSPTEGYESPEKIFGDVIRESRAAGKPFAIAETGSQLMPGDASGRSRAHWLRDTADLLAANNAVFVLYFDSVGASGADYRLMDRAGVTAWREVTRANG